MGLALNYLKLPGVLWLSLTSLAPWFSFIVLLCLLSREELLPVLGVGRTAEHPWTAPQVQELLSHSQLDHQKGPSCCATIFCRVKLRDISIFGSSEHSLQRAVNLIGCFL